MIKKYYTNPRKEACFFLGNETKLKILDIGCGAGSTTEFIKDNFLVDHSIGVDIINHENQEKVFDVIYNADLNDFNLREVLDAHKPNIILLMDVLEHLNDPYYFLKTLSEYKGNIKIIFSLPNVSHYSVFIPYIFRGTWDYKDSGVLDRTHLHFFGRNNVIDLFEKNSLQVHKLVPQYKLYPFSKSKLFHIVTLGLSERFIALQYVGVINKMDKNHE